MNRTVLRKLTPLDERKIAESETKGGDGEQFEDVYLADIKVGDILEIKDNVALPADCILLKSENKNGQVYVETAALDGERNLKPLFAPKEITEQTRKMELKMIRTS